VLKSVASNGAWWVAERVALLALVFAVNVVLVRALGPVGFGELSYLLAVVGLLLPVAQLGVSGLVARALLEKPDEEQRILRTAMLLRLAGAGAALLVGAAYWLLADDANARRAVLLLLLVAQPAAAFQVVEFWFQSRLRAGELVPWRTGALVVTGAAKVAVALGTGSVPAVAAVFAAEYVVLGSAYALAWRRVGGAPLRPARDAEWLRWFGQRAPWLFLSGIAESIYLRIDVVMLERLRGVAEAGTYAVAARVSEVWYALPPVLMAAIFPALWQRRGDAAAYDRSLQVSLDVLCGVALVIAIAMQFAAGPLVRLLFGPEFAASAAVLTLHVWAGVFVFMRAVLSRWLLAEDLLRFSLVTHAAGALVNVALNLVLIPRHGAFGAAWATVISYASAGWLALFLSARTRPLGWMMARALLLPLRWRTLAAYWRQVRAGTLVPSRSPKGQSGT
jgi:PST family polysaccharide transporter